MLKRYTNLISSILVIFFSAVLYFATFTIRRVMGMNIGADFFPRIASVGLAILGVIILSRSIIELRSAPTPEKSEKKPLSQGAVCTILTLALFLVYALAMEPLGFLISTAIYLFLEMLVLSAREARSYSLFAVIAIAASVVIYFSFTKIFFLVLPTGILG